MMDPFFLHPSDNLGLILVSQRLTNDNYSSWHKAMTMALIGTNKIGFVDGTIPIPAEGTPLHLSWRRNINIVASGLLNLISKDIAASVIYSSSTTDI